MKRENENMEHPIQSDPEIPTPSRPYAILSDPTRIRADEKMRPYNIQSPSGAQLCSDADATDI